MARTLPKRRPLPPDNPESPPSVKRRRRALEPTSTTSSKIPPSSCILSCLLSVQEARAVLNKAVKGPFTNLPIVNLPELFNVIEIRSERVLSTLPSGEHYALIDGELGRIKLRTPRRAGVSPMKGDESRAQLLLSQFKKKSELIKSSSESRLQSPLSQFRQSSALFNPSTPDPPPDDRPSEKVVTPRIRAGVGHSHTGNTPRSKGTLKSPSASLVVSAQDYQGGGLHPVMSKSPELEKFANRLSSLTVALYKAIELLPQMALRDLEGVLENDWMVEDMESTVMGVLSLVNGRDGEKQWRSGSGSGDGKL